MEYMLKTLDADNCKQVNILVEEGPLPYTVKLTFGSSYSVTLSAEDAAELAIEMGKVADFG